MKIKIISEKENALFFRKEIVLEIEADITPSKDKIMEIISERFKSDKNLVRVRKVDSKFGSNLFVVFADLYNSKESFEKVVKRTKQELKALEEAKKALEEAKS